jgi:hypothetical protein
VALPVGATNRRDNECDHTEKTVEPYEANRRAAHALTGILPTRVASTTRRRTKPTVAVDFLVA